MFVPETRDAYDGGDDGATHKAAIRVGHGDDGGIVDRRHPIRRGKAAPASAGKAVTAVDGGSQEVVPRMDVAFVVDATGSMHDEIEVIKNEIREVADDIAAGEPPPDVRFGLVLYRDKTDQVVVETTELTRNVRQIYRRLEAMEAKGGGDRREHVLGGLSAALDLDWENGPDVERSIYLVGDAPAHTDYPQEPTISEVVGEARRRGIPVETIGCSGIEGADGKAQFSSISSATSGRYRALTYHTVVRSGNGKRRSVVYRNGEFYAADQVLDESDWRSRPAELIASGALERAPDELARKARVESDRDNNLDRVIRDDLEARMREQGVAY